MILLPTHNNEIRRKKITWPNWETALGEISFEWFQENLTEKQFFDRWRSELHRIGEDMVLQQEVIDQANHNHSIRQGRAAYYRSPEKSREYARLQRKKIRGDPTLLLRKRESDRIKMARRAATDLNFLMRKRMRTRIFMALRGYQKAGGTAALLGCSMEEARKYIESLWLPGMTWGNWSVHGWHIDHIRPCDSFDLRNPKHQKECFHYTNLQPLWSDDNWSKGSKVL